MFSRRLLNAPYIIHISLLDGLSPAQLKVNVNVKI